MSRSKKESLAYSTAKNLVRGALSNKKGKPVHALSDGLSHLDLNDIRRFGAWIEQYPAKRTRLFPPPKIDNYNDLWPNAFLNVPDLLTALSWVAQLLSRHTVSVQCFLHHLSAYELAYLSCDYESAARTLDQIEVELGLSIWLIEARLGLIHRSKGLEAQKQYAQSIQIAAPKSGPAYVAHYASQRNEDSSSMDRYSTRITASVDKQPVTDNIKLYLKRVLVGTSDLSESSLCDVLCVASSVSLIDGYDACIDVLSTIMVRPELEYLQSDAIQLFSEFSDHDWRVRKMRATTCMDYSGLGFRNHGADEALYKGDFNLAVQLALKQARHDPLDIGALIVAATALTLEGSAILPLDLSAIQMELLHLFATLIARHDSLTKAADDMAKLVQNLKSVRSIRAAAGYSAQLWLEEPQVGHSDGSAAFYNSRDLDVRHWSLLPPAAASVMIEHFQTNSGHDLLTGIALKQLRNELVIDSQLESGCACELNAVAALYHGNTAQALEHAHALSQSDKEMWKRFGAKVELTSLIAMTETDLAVRRAAHYCAADETYRHVVPLRLLLEGKRWRDLRHLRGDIALPILLGVYWHTVNEAEHETTRRFAYDEFLKSQGVRRPSELSCNALDRNELIHFLNYVCVPEVMDVSFDVFSGTRALEEERLNICALLTELDPEHSTEYAEELRTIAKFRTIQDGLRDVDRSRLHVNTDAIGRWAQKQLKESFTRHKDLLRSGIGFAPDVKCKDTIRSSSLGSTPSDCELQYPEHEGDALLADIVDAIESEYLNNPDHGLDAYLSMRVRHGSLSGHLRGPVEERGLIVSKKEGGSEYQDNVTVAGRLALHPQERTYVFQAFAEFSAKYDSIIEDLTKNRLQIRTTKNPDGLFGLGFDRGPSIMGFVKNRIQETTSFDDFLVDVFTAINVLLSQVSLGVRDYILSTVKQAFESAFEVLRASLENTVASSAYVQLNSWIADVIPEVQAAIYRVADWFVPVQQREELALRTVDQMVDIGIEVARRAHRGFSPMIERDVEDIPVQSAAFLSDFTDVLFTVLDNVCCHSGTKSPWVKLRVWTEELDGCRRRVRIRVESEVTAGVFNTASQNKLARIKQQMASGEYRQRVNFEGGTGMLKLKRLVSTDERQVLDFDFIGEDAFYIDIGLVRSFSLALGQADGGVS